MFNLNLSDIEKKESIIHDVKAHLFFDWVDVCEDYLQKDDFLSIFTYSWTILVFFSNHVGHYTYLKLVKLACYEKYKGVETHLDSSR